MAERTRRSLAQGNRTILGGAAWGACLVVMAGLALRVPAAGETGSYPVQLAIVDGDRTLALAGQWVRIVPPVAVDRVRPLVQADGTLALRVTLRDAQGGGQKGEMLVHVRGLMSGEEGVTAPFGLASGETRTVTIPLPALKPQPAMKYAVALSTSQDTAQCYTRTEYMNWFAPARLTAAILEVTDRPGGRRVPMTRYQRVVLTVDPR